MDRTQFTFYDSFRRAAQRIKNKAHRCVFYDILTAYALRETEPDLDSLPDSVAIAFELIKPTLDASRRKASSGQKGGKSKQNESKKEAELEEPESKKEGKREKKKESESENEGEDECPPKSPFSIVLSVYANKINPTPSQLAIAELKGFVEDMGQECCLRAIDIALDEKKTSWSYIKAILKSKREQGVKCLADWDRVDEQREAQKAAKNSRNAGWEPGKYRELSVAEQERSKQDMERTKKLLAMMKEEE